MKVVKSIEPVSPDFLVECQEGEPGHVVCRGGNVMKGYIGLDGKAYHTFIPHSLQLLNVVHREQELSSPKGS